MTLTVAVREASSTERTFNRAVRKAMAQWEKQQRSVLVAAQEELKRFNDEVISPVAPVTEWDVARLRSVERGIREAQARFTRRINKTWISQANKATALAIAGVDDPMKAIGVTKELLPVFQVPDRVLVIANNYVPSLIVDVGDDIYKGVQRTLKAGLLGGHGTPEMVRDIKLKLGKYASTEKYYRGGSVFDKATRRTWTIFRTESNRLHELVHAQRVKEVSKNFPGLGSKWVHRPSQFPRASHQALHGKIIYPAKGEKFSLAGLEIDGPHDLLLPAEEEINCHCMAISTFDEDASVEQESDPRIDDDKVGMEQAKKGPTNELTPEKKKKKKEEEESPFELDDLGIPKPPGPLSSLDDEALWYNEMQKRFSGETYLSWNDTPLDVDYLKRLVGEQNANTVLSRLNRMIYSADREFVEQGIPPIRNYVFGFKDGYAGMSRSGSLWLSEEFLVDLRYANRSFSYYEKIRPMGKPFLPNPKNGDGQRYVLSSYFGASKDMECFSAFWHEMGHHTHNYWHVAKTGSKASKDLLSKNLTVRPNSPFEERLLEVFTKLDKGGYWHVTDYAGTNHYEWFAENFGMWKNNALREACDPAWIKFMKKEGLIS